MPEDRFVLHRIAWREVCPWLMIFRCFRLAISLPIMFLATIGALLMPSGESIAKRVFSDSDAQVISPMVPVPVANPPVGTSPVVHPPVVLHPPSILDRALERRDDIRGVFLTFVRPVANLFDRTATIREFSRNLFITLWNIAVWALLGAAITRIAVVHLGRDERVTLGDALRHSARNYGWNFIAPLVPLLGIALLLIPLAILGLLMRFDFGVLLAGLAWPVVVIAGFIMAVLLVGLLGGWPLMWPTISAEEESDAFEAFSRSFSYTFQRPLHYLFYAAVVVLLGILAWLLVGNFAEAVVALNHWGVSFGTGRERVAEVLTAPHEDATLLRVGTTLIHWWDWVVRMVAQAFNFGFFFCSASAIYLLLRRHVDQTDFDEVFVPDDVSRYGLPPLRTGPEGIPEVADPGAGPSGVDT